MPVLTEEKWVRAELDFPGNIARGSHDRAAVKRIQEWVSFHGFGTAIDEDFGPATAKAVQAFQAARGLSANGTVDARTFTELTRPMRTALAPTFLTSNTLTDAIVVYAGQHLAQHPIEIGNANCGPWVRLYMRGAEGKDQLWCAGFACTVVRQATEALKAGESVKYTVSCDALGAAARQQERFLSGKAILSDPNKAEQLAPGSLFLIRNQKNANDYVHTGIVIAADRDSFTAIEGNTDHGGSRNGFEVCRRERAYTFADFYLAR